MRRTTFSHTALLLAAALLLLPTGCHRATEPALVSFVDDTVRDATQNASKPDACAAEVTSLVAAATPTEAVPTLTRRVTDQAGILTAACVADLNERLKKLETDTGAQVAVLIVPATHGMDIDAYANAVYHRSKLGRKGVDDGALLVVSQTDRHARIEVGYGLEGAIPDAVAGDILRADLKENFAASRYNAGISLVVNDLAKRVRSGGAVPVRPREHGTRGLWFFLAMLALSLVLGGVAESLKLRWPLRLLLIPVAVDAVVLLATALQLTLGYRLLIAMVPISLTASLLGIPLVRSTQKSLQWVGTCLLTSLIIAGIAAAINRSNGYGFHVPHGWGFAAGAIGTAVGSIFFLLTQVLPGSRRSRRSSRNWDDSRSSTSSSSDSSSSDSGSSSSSDSGSMSGGGGDSGGGGASTSW